MDANELLEYIREDERALREQNVEVIYPKNFYSWVKELEALVKSSEGGPLTDAQIEENRATHQSNLAAYNVQWASNLEMFRATVQYGQAALKSVILINGGASVALLAFIGNIFSNNIVEPKILIGLSNSLIGFVLGVLFSAVAVGLTYLAQSCFGLMSKGGKLAGHVLNGIIISLVISAYYLFFYGAFEAYKTFMPN